LTPRRKRNKEKKNMAKKSLIMEELLKRMENNEPFKKNWPLMKIKFKPTNKN